jgi:hypothetical protein
MTAEAEDMVSSPPTKKTKSSKPRKSQHVFLPFHTHPPCHDGIAVLAGSGWSERLLYLID